MRISFTVLAAFMLLVTPIAGAQEMTERHIPVGAYPGLASKYLTSGTISAVDEAAGTVMLGENGTERRFRVTENTKIWLDRSALGQTTLDGDISDLSRGVKAEVRSLGPEQPDVAYWIKVRMTSP